MKKPFLINHLLFFYFYSINLIFLIIYKPIKFSKIKTLKNNLVYIKIL